MSPDTGELLAAARAVFRPELFDAALGHDDSRNGEEPADGIGAFAGPAFDPERVTPVASPRP